PGSPGDRSGVRRPGDPCQADHARQDLAGDSSWPGRVRRPAHAVRGHALPLAGGGAGLAAGLPGSHRVDGEPGRLDRRDHGPASQDADGGGRAVPPGVDPDPARPRHAAQFPRPAAAVGGMTGEVPRKGEAPGKTVTITPQEALQRTIEHREIFHDEMIALMRQIMRGDVSPLMTAAIITGLRVKKETVGEITGAARVMRELSAKVPVTGDHTHLLDIVGTGGDGASSFNISTTSMFVAAAAGARVAKHGGRSVSSKSGSADVLEALGAAIDLAPAQVAECMAETGIGFMFAPNHHP